MRDLHDNVDERVALNIQAISSDTTTNGVIIDTQGYESVEFIMQAGAVSAGDVTALIQDDTDSAMGTATAVPDTYLLGTEAATILDAANEISRIGYKPRKRYVRFNAVTANSANLTVGAIVVLSNPAIAPVA